MSDYTACVLLIAAISIIWWSSAENILFWIDFVITLVVGMSRIIMGHDF